MGMTTTGKNGIISLIGSASYEKPNFCAVGTGSSTFSQGNTTLLSEAARGGFATKYTGSEYFSNWTFDFNASQLSGLTIYELGMLGYISGGYIWDREVFSGLFFNGRTKMKIYVDMEVY